MPLFEFACSQCDHRVELLIRSAEETPVCPDCGGTELTKLISAPAAPAIRSGGGLPVAARSISEAAAACPAMRCCGGGCDSL